MQRDLSVGTEVEETLYSLQVLHLGMVKLLLQLPILKKTRSANVGRKQDTENGNVPERKAASDVSKRDGHFFVPSIRITKPTPRTVCRSLTGQGSSILRRMRAICTSITLSIEV